MPGKTLSNVIGFDDAPFEHQHRDDVPVVGTVYAGLRLDGFLTGKVRRDGANAATKIAALVEGSRFREHLQLLMFQGIALAGFNVVDAKLLHRRLGLPVLVVARRQPNMESIRDALLLRVSGGRRKWSLIESLGAMEPCGSLFMQRVGLSKEEARLVVKRFAIHGNLPEPLRIAHLVAGAMVRRERCFAISKRSNGGACSRSIKSMVRRTASPTANSISQKASGSFCASKIPRSKSLAACAQSRATEPKRTASLT